MENLLDADKRLPSGKAVGPDGVHAELLKAGGLAFGTKLFGIVSRLIASEVWPVQWKGGRIVDLFKGKGSAAVCDNSRGLLISDHVVRD